MSDDDGARGPGFHRVHPVSPFLRGGLLLAALAVTLGRQALEGDEVSWPWWAFVLAVLGAVTVGAVSWWFTRYRIGSDELRIDSGVLVRRSRRIRLDRIQAVEVQQPFLARLVGMAALAIETAGGSGTEATLAYLPLRQASELRRHLLVEAAREAGATGPAPDGPVPDGPLPDGPVPDRARELPVASAAPGDELLHRVDPGLLLAAQLLRTGPLLAALAAVSAALVGTLVGEPLSVAVLVPMALGVSSAVLQGFVSGYGFTVRRSAQGLSSRAGLFGVRSAALPVQRVRGLVVREPIVWRRLGWVSVDVTVAGVVVRDDDDKRLSTTLVPVARRDDAERLVAQVLPGLGSETTATTPPPPAARFLDPLSRRRLGLGGDAAYVVTRRGLLTRRTDVAPRDAVQSAGLRQGPLQRRLGLATVGLHLPSGPADPTATHRSAAEAWELMLATGVPGRPGRSARPARPA